MTQCQIVLEVTVADSVETNLEFQREIWEQARTSQKNNWLRDVGP